MRIAVTGHLGFVGRWIFRAASLGAYDVQPLFPLPQSDIRDMALVERQLKELAPDVVIHLASIASSADAQADHRRCLDVNFGGTFNVATAILNHLPKCWLVFIGSSEAYGASFNATMSPLNEEAPLNPLNVYGVSKAAADLLVGQMSREGLASVRLRPFNHTGPEQTLGYVVPTIASQIARIEHGLQDPVLKIGDLAPERDFLDVRDVVAAYMAVVNMRHTIPYGTPINISSGEPVKIATIVDLLVGMSRCEIEVEADPRRRSPNGVLRASGDPTTAQRYLGWSRKIALEETLQETLNYWRRHVSPANEEL